MIDAELAKHPENAALWAGRGGLLYKLENWEDAIVAFEKVAELQPNVFFNQFRLGYVYALWGDKVNEKVNTMSWSSNSDYDNAIAGVLDIYEKSLTPLEKAYELNNTDSNTLQLLKQLYFRLRDRSPEHKAKYDKYNELLKQLEN